MQPLECPVRNGQADNILGALAACRHQPARMAEGSLRQSCFKAALSGIERLHVGLRPITVGPDSRRNALGKAFLTKVPGLSDAAPPIFSKVRSFACCHRCCRS